jgi:hypothetical protein
MIRTIALLLLALWWKGIASAYFGPILENESMNQRYLQSNSKVLVFERFILSERSMYHKGDKD